MKKIKKLIKKWDYLACILKVWNIKIDGFISRFYSDEEYLKKQYKKRTGKTLDFNNLNTFNEKIQWLKLYYRNNELHKSVDKCEARKIVEKKIGKEILTKCYGVYDRFEDIDFDSLPDKFILKLTNGSSFNYICLHKTKKEIRKMRRRFKMWLKVDYYSYAKEWAYKDVKNRILCEELLETNAGTPPKEYRFFCFDGKVFCFHANYDATLNGIRMADYKRNVYDRDGNRINARIKYQNNEDVTEEKFDGLDKAIKYAEILAKGYPHVRIDFFCFDGKIYFGEITFYHASGYQKMTPKEFELKMGSLINLDKLSKEI